eukprot:1114691-Rhodomonas_salina.3
MEFGAEWEVTTDFRAVRAGHVMVIRVGRYRLDAENKNRLLCCYAQTGPMRRIPCCNFGTEASFLAFWAKFWPKF